MATSDKPDKDFLNRYAAWRAQHPELTDVEKGFLKHWMESHGKAYPYDPEFQGSSMAVQSKAHAPMRGKGQ